MTIRPEVNDVHTRSGTLYGEDSVGLYALARHGPDGARFLDPFFQQYLLNLNGEEVIDVGTGAAPWAIFAALHGARRVFAVDLQNAMVTTALREVNDASLDDKVIVLQADGASLPLKSSTFDMALSINVGCNLPLTVKIENSTRSVGFDPHFAEIARVLKPGGKLIVTAPTSFGEVFTSGRQKNAIMVQIRQALVTIGPSGDPDVIKKTLNTLEDVYRATFAFRDGRLQLVTDEATLISGEKIYRKLPGLTVPNLYHAEAEYDTALAKHGLQVVLRTSASFGSEEEREATNQLLSEDKKLGPEYVGNPPFVVWVAERI